MILFSKSEQANYISKVVRIVGTGVDICEHSFGWNLGSVHHYPATFSTDSGV
jgi:hypothetical protein